MTNTEKEMKISQTYRAASIATRTIDSTPQEPKSALRGLMHRLGLAFLACYARHRCDQLCEGRRGSRRSSRSRARRWLRSRLSFRRMPTSEHRYLPKMEPS